jgi:hypothetical protein
VSSSVQTYFMILLALIKIVLRNWISRFLTNMDDLKPLVLIFNIDVFHALYVSCSLQSSTSFTTTLVVMFVDFVQACISLTDIHLAEVKLTKVIRKIPMNATTNRNFLSICAELLNDPDVANHPRLQSERYRSMLAHASHHVGKTGSKYTQSSPSNNNRNSSSVVDHLVHATSDTTPESIATIREENQLQPKTASVIPIKQSGSASATVIPINQPLEANATDDNTKQPNRILSQLPAIGEASDVLQHPGINVALAKALTLDERVNFIKDSVDALFLTEFLGLVEYTEVMMPIIYAIYLMAMSQLSNRQYYPRLAALSDEELRQMTASVMTYVSFEFISFVVMASAIYYKLRISTLHQVAFVLESHAPEIQSKLALWTLYIVQSMLIHSGACGIELFLIPTNRSLTARLWSLLLRAQEWISQ